jgi:tetratricopeptide (TPR) repeat protein
VYNSLGLIYASRGEHERAIEAFRRALDLEPGVGVTEHNLGRSLHAIEAYDEALFHYQLALVLDEPRASTLVNMAIAYYETGQMVEAADAARKALAYDETSVPAYTVLGAVALQSWQPKEALPALRRATELDADYFQAQFYLGQAYKALGQPSEAAAAFEQALIRTDDPILRREIRRYLDEIQELEKQSGSP